MGHYFPLFYLNQAQTKVKTDANGDECGSAVIKMPLFHLITAAICCWKAKSSTCHNPIDFFILRRKAGREEVLRRLKEQKRISGMFA